MEQCNPFQFVVFPLSKKNPHCKSRTWESKRRCERSGDTGSGETEFASCAQGEVRQGGQERQRGKKMVKATNAEILDGLFFLHI